MPYQVDVKTHTVCFEHQEEAYTFLLMMLKDVPLLFEIWTSLNSEYQLEQVGMFLVEPTILPSSGEKVMMGKFHTHYQKAYPHFRCAGSPYPSPSEEKGASLCPPKDTSTSLCPLEDTSTSLCPLEDTSTSLSSSKKTGWYPSISYEQFIRSFPDIPFSVLDLMGKRKNGWKVTPIDREKIWRSPPGLGKPHRKTIPI